MSGRPCEINPLFLTLRCNSGSLIHLMPGIIGELYADLHVGDIHITDAAAYQAHIPRALASIARFGGRVIAGGGSRVDLLEGEPSPEWIFIIEFTTADAARGWYQSDHYREALKVRQSASHGRVFLIEGAEIS